MEKEIHSNGGVVPCNQGGKPPINRNLLQLLIAMKLFLLILALSLKVSAAVYSQQQISLTVTKAPLREVMQSISKQSGYNFIFRSVNSNRANPVTVSLNLISIEEALNQVFKGQPFTFIIDNKIIVISKKKEGTGAPSVSLETGPIIIKGKVTDSKNQPLPGVNVRIKGGSIGTVTDDNGHYTINTNGPGVLLFSYLGYRTVEKKFTDKAEFNIVLEDISSQLDQVQIIAYGSTIQRYNTSNITSIKGDEITKQPISNVLLGLQGRAPGLYLGQSSGVPGADIKVRVQGENSLRNGNEAFYVIDGVPYTPQNLYSGISATLMQGSGSALSFLNPSDVESIEILKDADATAIYGSKAANGAILITTRKGKAGKTKVDLNMQSGWGQTCRRIKLLNTDEYIQMRNEALKNNNQIPDVSDYDINGTWDQKRYTDWQKELVGGTAHFTSLQGTISGGSDNTQFLVGTGYVKETTVYPGNFSDTKGNLNISVNHTSSNKKFEFNIKSIYLQDINRMPTSDLTSTAITLAPNAPKLYNEDGSLNWEPIAGSPNSSTFTNPIAQLLRKYKGKTYNILENTVIGYKILPGLTLKSSFGYNRLQTDELSTSPQISFSPTILQNSRSAIYGNKFIASWIIEPQLTYSKEFAFGNIDALLGSSFQSTDKSVIAFDGTNYSNDSQLENSLAAGTITPDFNSMQSKYRYNALFGRVNYRFKDKYILNLSARRDGSSRFGSENLFHSFYSIGAAWLFSDEDWFKSHFPAVTYGKLRLTYGTTGNDQIRDYQFLNLYTNYTLGVSVPYQQSVGLLPTGHSNPYLQWEETRKLNIGLDLGFFNNRVILNSNYYQNRSSNQLLDYPLTFMTGFSGVQRNIPALIQNSGWEIAVDAKPIKGKDFNWQISLNLTVPKNKLVSYPDIENSSYSDLYKVGSPTSIIKVYNYAGVNKETGYYEFLTKDGKLTSTPDYGNDRTQTIDLAQKFYGGINNSFRFHGFELSFLFQYVKQMGQNYNAGTYFPGFALNQPTTILDHWKNVNDNKSIQKITTSFDSFTPFASLYQSTGAYSDASFIRLKNAALYYTLPTTLINKIHLSNLRVYVQGQNLLTFTNFKGSDPETLYPGTLPPLRVISTGLQITF